MREDVPWKVFPCIATILAVACSSSTQHPPALGDSDQGDGGAGAADAGNPRSGTRDASSGDSSAATDASRAAWGPDKCPATPAGVSVGYATGNQLGTIVVKDCNDNDVSLDRFCGASALWIFGANGWCASCQTTSNQAESIMASYAGKNVAAVVVLVQNTQVQPPSAADCKAWVQAYHLGTNVVPLYDPNGALQHLDGTSSTLPGLSAFVASDRVITDKVYEGDKAKIESDIDAALAH